MGGVISAFVSTAQWSEIPGILWDDLIKPGLFVMQWSKMLYL